MFNSQFSPLVVTLTCIYTAGMGIFTILFLIFFIINWKNVRPYLKYGLWLGCISIGLDIFILVITPSAWGVSLLLGLFLEPLILIRLIGFTALGTFYCAEKGYPSLPILLRKFKKSGTQPDAVNVSQEPAESPLPVEEIEMQEPQIVASTAEDIPSVEEIKLPEEIKKKPPVDVLLEINWKHYFLTVSGAVLIAILYSTILFLLVRPSTSELIQTAFGKAGALDTKVTVQSILVVLEFAIAEELFFRLGIQSFLVRHLKLTDQTYWIAIVITAALWTVGHAGTLNPEWVKLAQIFPIGLMLGWLFKKYGAESTILVHGLFNVIFSFMAVYLIH